MRAWIQAYGLSILLHAGVATALVFRLPMSDLAPETAGPVTITLAAAPTPQPVQELRPEPLPPVAAPAALSPIAAEAGLAPVMPVLPEVPEPEPEMPPAAAEEGDEMSELAQRIRARVTDPCLIALPLEGAEVVVLSSDDRAIRDFSDDVLTEETARPVLVDARQCPAVNFARANAAYPAFPLSIALRSADVSDPGTLSGQVRAAAGRHVTLLLVDDNGVVQDLRRFMRYAGPVAQFEVPVRRDGGARDTAQMLVALATTAPPRAVVAEDGQTAETMFASLTDELGTNMAMAVVAFALR